MHVNRIYKPIGRMRKILPENGRYLQDVSYV